MQSSATDVKRKGEEQSRYDRKRDERKGGGQQADKRKRVREQEMRGGEACKERASKQAWCKAGLTLLWYDMVCSFKQSLLHPPHLQPGCIAQKLCSIKGTQK